MISQFDDIINEAINVAGLVPGLNFQDSFALINAVIQKESSFDPNATSSVGAIGLMQVNPSFWGFYIDLYDPYTNIVQGIKILRQYISSYGLTGGLAAYHAGPSGMYLQVAKDYASTVLSFFNSFRQKIASMFRISSGEYYIDPGSAGGFPQINVNDLSTLPPLDTLPPVDYGTSYFPATTPQAEPDYTWIYIAAGIIIILAVIR